MEVSKVQLSGAELDLVHNADIILTKNRIIRKAISLFEALQDQMLNTIQHTGAQVADIYRTPPKISRGENYRELPYVVLDYPRTAHMGNLAFIRTLFWWGHFFSSTLHVSGFYRERTVQPASAAFHLLAKKGYYIGIQSDPWQHHFEKDNYQKLSEITEAAFPDLLLAHSHIKIAARWPLAVWNDAGDKLLESWELLRHLIS
jgi:hypothetical protein